MMKIETLELNRVECFLVPERKVSIFMTGPESFIVELVSRTLRLNSSKSWKLSKYKLARFNLQHRIWMKWTRKTIEEEKSIRDFYKLFEVFVLTWPRSMWYEQAILKKKMNIRDQTECQDFPPTAVELLDLPFHIVNVESLYMKN